VLLRAILISVLLVTSAGCGFTPNAYQAPRTVAPGTLQAALSIDSLAAASPRWDHIPKTGLHVRYGVHKRVDLSASTTLPGSYTVGGKVHIIASEYIDVAWLARGNVTYLRKAPIDYSDLTDVKLRCPVAERYCQGQWLGLLEMGPLVGLNFVSAITLVASTALYARAKSPRRSPQDLGFRVSLGLQWRLTDDIAVMPEVAYLPNLSPLNERTVFYGIAVLARGADGYAKK
jgi:hypothetical protein